VNFRPTNGGVTINGNGEWNGYAWVGGLYGGWIKFDCASPSSCVKTDWRAVQYRPIVVTNNNTGGVLPLNTIQTTSTATLYTTSTAQINIDTTESAPPHVYPRYTEPRVQTVVQPNTYTTYQPTYTNTYVSPVLANTYTEFTSNKVETKTRVIAFPFVPSRTRVPVKVGGVKIDMVSVVLVTLVLVLLIMAIRLRVLV
jgi:hypothetical protein